MNDEEAFELFAKDVRENPERHDVSMSDDAVTEEATPIEMCPVCKDESDRLARLGPRLQYVCHNEECQVQLFAGSSGVLEKFESGSPPHLFAIQREITDDQRETIKRVIEAVMTDE